MRIKINKVFKWVVVLFFFWTFIFAGNLNFWFYRSNTSYINRGLSMETWDVVADGKHNSNTDMIYWKGYFYLAYISSTHHWGTTASKLVIQKSTNAQDWQKVTELKIEGKDIRDPKFANITGKLYIYVLPNEGIIAAPAFTLYTVSSDGTTWSPWQKLNGVEDGWLFWRPKQHPNGTWFCPAYWNEHGRSALFRSNDGVNWSFVSMIYTGETNDETAIEFLHDERIICTARLEGFSDINPLGDATASTLISVAKAPYTSWNQTKSYTTRMDGPYIFSYNNNTYVAGRYEPEAKGSFSQLGSFFCKKRTSLYKLEEDELIYLSDLPSAGDTSYTGVVQKDGYVYISYYTSDITKDYVWVMGQLAPSNIRIAKIKLTNLEAVGNNPPNIEDPSPFKFDSLLLDIGFAGMAVIILIAITRQYKSYRPNQKRH